VHGLRSAANLLGWTRLLDEWIGGVLDRGATANASDDLADAVKRTRAFVFGGDLDAAAPERAADGSLRFELRGACYDAHVRSITIDGDVGAVIERAFAESTPPAPSAPEAVVLRVLIADVPATIADAVVRDAALACATDALAWVLAADPRRRRVLVARRAAS
jgi:hypothetical protein